jgi:hypothetical protein
MHETGTRVDAPGHAADSARSIGKWRKATQLITVRGFALRMLRGRLYGFMRNHLGLAAPMLTEDRRVLEQIIFLHYCDNPLIKTVLFVGCDSYTAHYERQYFAGHNYWTIDPDAGRRRFGAKQHVTARLQELDRYFSAGFFDLIIFNGVYGWGLNTSEDCAIAAARCYFCLSDAGHLVFGWNDVPESDPAPSARVSCFYRFSTCSLPAFGDWQYLTDTRNRHTYNFYQKTPCAQRDTNLADSPS